MRRVLSFAACLLIAACAGTSGSTGPKKYRAWCKSESKPLGEWHEDRKKAEADRKEHERLFRHHVVNIWTAN